MSDIIAIALNKLDADPKNVRKTYTKESIESLSASILANGVIQNLVVRKASKGRYLVTAGGRRLQPSIFWPNGARSRLTTL